LRASIDVATDPVARMEHASLDAMPEAGVPRIVRYSRAGISLSGYPALVAEAAGTRVALRVLDVESAALRTQAGGVSVLIAREIREAVEHHVAYHPLAEELCALLARAGIEDAVAFVARSVARIAVGDSMTAPREPAALLAIARSAERTLAESVAFVVRTMHAMLVATEEILARTRGIKPNAQGGPKEQILARLAEVLARETGAASIADPIATLSQGLEAIATADRDELAQRARLIAMLVARLERLREIGPVRDRAIEDELAPWRVRVEAALRSRTRSLVELTALSRMFEEIEISRFAPKMPRNFPASEKRLAALLGDE
jgi:hypothetical protein